MIPLFKPYMPATPEIDELLHSGAIAYGEYTKRFEEKLRDYFKTPYLIVTDNYSNAIWVALASLGIEQDSGIIASPMACLASTQPYLTYGLEVRWADVDPTTGTLDPNSVRQHINKNIKAIVHNHFCGYPGYIDEINKIGREFGIPVIDDGIECFGSEYKGRLIGNCDTDVTIFSLSAVRFCNCIEGGVVIFKNREQFQKSLLIRDFGIDRSNFRDELGEINPNLDINLVGYSATMSNINGYIGCLQMDNVTDLLNAHRLQAKKWNKILQSDNEVQIIDIGDSKPNYWVFGTLVRNKQEAIKKFRTKGYYASGVHIRNDKYSVFGKSDTNLPGVNEFSQSFVALPCGWWME